MRFTAVVREEGFEGSVGGSEDDDVVAVVGTMFV